ncbi:MAG: TIGR04283 family arsenosugar biosynthesis glycosyltransferase [Gammaproteobacteria bacterium]|nr:TIGR04283 family arsenosugar biosynthesis glycosyltransferase [Gammaproteobacteria bacterium]
MVSSSRPYIRRKIRQPNIQAGFLDAENQLSIIIPALNETRTITSTLISLQGLRQSGHEVILVDGGSTDDTVSLAEGLVDQIVHTDPGRGRQMNAGASHAWGDTLLFLHADSLLPDAITTHISRALSKREWGRFNVRLSGRNPLFRIIERLINIRSCVSGIATGDQAIFLSRSLFEQLGGYAELPLMEDIELSNRLKAFGRPACVSAAVITSSRRWEHNGIIKTVLLMWRLRWGYYRGIPAETLAKEYYPKT